MVKGVGFLRIKPKDNLSVHAFGPRKRLVCMTEVPRKSGVLGVLLDWSILSLQETKNDRWVRVTVFMLVPDVQS